MTTTALIKPIAPFNLTSSEITGTAFKISWSGDSRAISYTYSLNGVTTVPSNNQGLASKFAVFSGLFYGTQYSVIITATNSVDSTPSAALNVTTGPATVNWTYYILLRIREVLTLILP